MRCPTCRRRAGQEEETCPRCGTVLTELRDVLAAAERELHRGRELLKQGRFDQALQALERSRSLCHTRENAQALAVAHLCNGRFADALRWYAAASEDTPTE